MCQDIGDSLRAGGLRWTRPRFLIEAHLRTGRPVGELAKAHGVSRGWLYKLLARYNRGARPGWSPAPGARTARRLPPPVAGRFDEIEQSAWAAINPLTGDGGVRYAAFWDWLGAHLPAEPCWFLDAVAVAPAAQGRGLGRTLVMHGLERARADGCPAFLETGTPRNVPFYQSLGFQIVGEQQAPDGGPTIWFMQTPRLPAEALQRLRTACDR